MAVSGFNDRPHEEAAEKSRIDTTFSSVTSGSSFEYHLSSLSFWFKRTRVLNILMIALLVGTLGVAVMVVQQTQDIREEASEHFVSLEIPSRDSIKVGEEVEIPVMLLAESVPVASVSVALRFDRNYLQVNAVKIFPDSSGLDRYHPIVDGKFDESGVIVTANNSGIIRFMTESSSGNPFRGVRSIDKPLAKIKLKSIKRTDAPSVVEFITQNGASMATAPETGENILTYTGEMKLNIK